MIYSNVIQYECIVIASSEQCLSSVLVASGTFWCKNAIYDAYKLKDTHTKYLYECLSTVISTVLSVQVYYYIRTIITTFKTEYFTHFKQKIVVYLPLKDFDKEESRIFVKFVIFNIIFM